MSNSLKKLTKRDLFHAYAYWMMFALAATEYGTNGSTGVCRDDGQGRGQAV